MLRSSEETAGTKPGGSPEGLTPHAGKCMTTDGLGQTKPLAPNETPQGRAENRRVEFVKL